MSKTTIIDNEYVTLWHHPEDKIVHHHFHKFIHGDTFREVLLKGLEIFREQDACKWLSDDRDNSALPKDDGIWAITEWSPQVMEAGWKYWAIVLPDKVLGQTNMNQFMKHYIEQGLVVTVFEDPDEALVWLKSVN